MKTMAFAVLVFCCGVALCTAQDKGGKDKILLVKIGGIDGKSTYKTMTQSEYNTLAEQIKADNSLTQKAMALADKAWKEDEETKKKTFPRTAIFTRSAAMISMFTDQAKADERLSAIEDKESARAKDEKKRQDEKDKAKKRTAEELKKEQMRDKDREYFEGRARDIFEGKLTELKTKAADAADAADGKKEEKKEEKK